MQVIASLQSMTASASVEIYLQGIHYHFWSFSSPCDTQTSEPLTPLPLSSFWGDADLKEALCPLRLQGRRQAVLVRDPWRLLQ